MIGPIAEIRDAVHDDPSLPITRIELEDSTLGYVALAYVQSRGNHLPGNARRSIGTRVEMDPLSLRSAH